MRPIHFSFPDPNVGNGDIYYCKLTAPGVCNTTLIRYTDTFNMSVLPITTTPTVIISANPGLGITPAQTVTFTANVQNGGITPKYQWYKNGIIATGATYATLTTNGLSYGDLISVNIISQDPCTQIKTASDTVRIQFPADIDGLTTGNFNLYPNPNKGSFTITGLAKDMIDVLVMNAHGQVVHHQIGANTNGSISVNAQLVPGHYTLKLVSNKEQKILPFTVHP